MFDCRTCCTNTGTHAAFEARPTRGKLRGGGVWSAAETFLSQGFCQSVKYSTSVPQYLKLLWLLWLQCTRPARELHRRLGLHQPRCSLIELELMVLMDDREDAAESGKMPQLRTPCGIRCKQCLSIYLSTYPSIHLSIYLSIYLMYACNAMQCNAMQCNAMQCNAMEWNGMEWNVCMYVPTYLPTYLSVCLSVCIYN